MKVVTEDLHDIIVKFLFFKFSHFLRKYKKKCDEKCYESFLIFPRDTNWLIT